MTHKFFFAFPGASGLTGESMRLAAAQLRQAGAEAKTWQELNPDGQWIPNEIFSAIRAADTLVAEVSDMNPNVLFECGFALALNKAVRLAFDETDGDAVTRWKKLGLLVTVGRTDYGGNGAILANKLLTTLSDEPPSTLLEMMLVGGAPKSENAVFCPSLPHMFGAAADLERNLDRKRYLTVLGANEELGLAPLDFYVKTAYRSSAAILHLMKPSRLQALEHNQRVSFIGGLLHGLGVPLLFVVEPGLEPPIDYKDFSYQYVTSASLQKHVDEWLEKLPNDGGKRTRLGRLVSHIELPIDSFGQYVAEYERDNLHDYYVHTSEFQSVLHGTSSIFVGRKGTGKTATMSEITRELRTDRANLVVPIKPSSYETAGLLDLLSSIPAQGNQEYFLQGLWKYLIFSEVGLRLVEVAQSRPAGIQAQTPEAELSMLLEGFGIRAEQDLSVRLEHAVGKVAGALEGIETPDQTVLSHSLNRDRTERLAAVIRTCLGDFSRVAILFDNLDKAWDSDTHPKELASFLLALLVARGRVEHDLRLGREELVVTATVFIRSDIHEVLLRHAREPDKIGAASVVWQDHELLMRVLEDRYRVIGAARSRAPVGDLWEQLFVEEIYGMRVRDYFAWRALARPRDVIYLANSALTSAINRKHHRIESDDIRQAERLYSKFALDALMVESRKRPFDVELVLYSFIGSRATLGRGELQEAVPAEADFGDVLGWLVSSGFLGVESKSGVFRHVETSDDATRLLKVGTVLASKESREPRYRIHPAYRPILEVVEDDIHDEFVVDGTLAP